jgi:hypothetical protein
MEKNKGDDRLHESRSKVQLATERCSCLIKILHPGAPHTSGLGIAVGVLLREVHRH